MDTPEKTPTTDRTTKLLRAILAVAGLLVVVCLVWLGYAYATSPDPIRHPSIAHYHFRLQVINDGTPANFADLKYQTPFNKDICTAALTKEPIHFHDGVDQFVHIHWSRINGGILLKDYGWNFIGGLDGTLGYKFQGFHLPQRVPIHGRALPLPPPGAGYYVYTGNQNSYQERSWKEFLSTDLKTFFAGTPVSTADEAGSAKLNDVVGSVVIFAQPTKPTDAQVRARFQHLIPLPNSSCSG